MFATGIYFTVLFHRPSRIYILFLCIYVKHTESDNEHAESDERGKNLAVTYM